MNTTITTTTAMIKARAMVMVTSYERDFSALCLVVDVRTNKEKKKNASIVIDVTTEESLTVVPGRVQKYVIYNSFEFIYYI